MEDLRFEHPCQQIVFQEYVDMVKHAQGRLEALEQQMLAVLETWSMREVAIALMALRGVKLIAAMTIFGGAWGSKPVRICTAVNGVSWIGAV